MSFFGDLVDALLGRDASRPQTTSPDEYSVRLAPGVEAYLSAAYSVDGEAREREALERLRESGDQAVADVADAYWRAGESDFALRWSLVHCAVELHSRAATAFLADVMTAPIASERSHDVHLFSSVGEETTQRFRALQGLRDLAADGDDAATSALVDGLHHPLLAVRATAYQHLRELPDLVDGDLIAQRLTDDDRRLFERLRRVDVRETGQVDDPVELPDLPSPDDYRAPERRQGPPHVRGEDHG